MSDTVENGNNESIECFAYFPNLDFTEQARETLNIHLSERSPPPRLEKHFEREVG